MSCAIRSDGGTQSRRLTPREARDRWLDKLRVDKAESTVADYKYRLKHFVEWCEGQGIDDVGDLDGWLLESYETKRRRDGLEPVTLAKELGTLIGLLEYCERLEVVEDGTADKLELPDVPRQEQVDDTRLREDAAMDLLEFFSTDPEWRWTRQHALLSLAWYTGARSGALRGLDVDDVLYSDHAVYFHHRPDRGTPLKNGREGERIVGLPDEAWETLKGYLRERQDGIRSEEGNRPLFPSRMGRASTAALRSWMQIATEPCLHSDCPHGRQRETCEWTEYTHASKCPSSRSPHQVRTGSITWQLNSGLSKDVVAERVNTSVRTLKQHYDVESEHRAQQQRRQEHIENLSLEDTR